MSVGRYARHVKAPEITKEHFEPCTQGTEAYGTGAHHGYRVDATSDYALIEVLVPFDFIPYVDEVAIVCIPYASLAVMTVGIMLDYAAKGEPYFQHWYPRAMHSFGAVLNQMAEIDISKIMPALRAGDYLGIEVWREVAHNMNALVLGARFRYKARAHL